MSKKKILMCCGIVVLLVVVVIFGYSRYLDSRPPILEGVPLSYAEGFAYNGESYRLLSTSNPSQRLEFIDTKINELGDFYLAGQTENQGFRGSASVYFVGPEEGPCLIKTKYDYEYIYVAKSCTEQ